MTHYIISFCVLQFAVLKFLLTNKEETTEVHKKVSVVAIAQIPGKITAEARLLSTNTLLPTEDHK